MRKKEIESSQAKLHTIKEFSDLTGISESEIIRLVLLKKIKALRIGKSVRITEKELELFIDSLIGKNFSGAVNNFGSLGQEKILYTAEQVAKILNLSVDNVWLLLKTGKLKGFKIREGRSSWRIPVKSLEEFISYRMRIATK
ncbi:MAG: helix-turn-helix domain-containing protein [Actinobacteria bacterium]|nr:helix-turn-helix domain-containing protein [Actinomycetota bacterium]MBM3713912.1 helix-turn-helix domain-containing protein [Actinomycetota bacterium]